MENVNLMLSDVDFVRLMAMPTPPELRAVLECAIVFPAESMIPGVVTMQSRVCYRDQQTGQSREVEIVFPEDADASRGRVSVLAPVGAALIGLAIGQEIDWEFPDASLRRLLVLDVSYPEGNMPGRSVAHQAYTAGQRHNAARRPA
ncbi:MAG: GreA/GreB family elongation factor [Dechloromonas sp.]|jgi:regulator of nucleoside diphosphate kinase|nr:GreA/GreB family elongation factor [Candidatus Dechloromonas phosphoritropha]MBP8786303.1 GreA/GreB family elongation factor [Azonexus sp.]MBP9228748.1 GreA/GreB family elongation factor [Azonexus sp.]